MGDFLGADTVELRDAAGQLHEGAALFTDTDTTVTGYLETLPWVGPDQVQFREDWQQVHGPFLRDCAQRMQEFAQRLVVNADEQDQASGDSASAGTAGPAPSTTPAPPGPQTTAPTGEHVPYADPVDTSDAAFNPDNMHQGQIGDCWLVSGAGAVGMRDPQWIRDHMQRNADGSYTVTLYENGKPVPVTVSSEFVEHGAKGADGKPSWISVYEKAIAQHRGGSYTETDGLIGSTWERVTGRQDDIHGGFGDQTMELITGREADFDRFASFDKIERDLANGNAVTVGTKQPIFDWMPGGPADPNVVGGHEYVVDRVEVRDGVRQMHIVNPWGRGGDLWLTEEQFNANIQNSSSVAMPPSPRPTVQPAAAQGAGGGPS